MVRLKGQNKVEFFDFLNYAYPELYAEVPQVQRKSSEIVFTLPDHFIGAFEEYDEAMG